MWQGPRCGGAAELACCRLPPAHHPPPAPCPPPPRVPQGLQQATWPEAMGAVAKAAAGLKGSQMRAIAGKLADAESMVALKDLFNRLGSGDLRVRRRAALRLLAG